MGPYARVDYNLNLCRLQNRLQHMYHGQPYARIDLNPMPEPESTTLSTNKVLWIWTLIRNARANMLCEADVQWVFVMPLFIVSLIFLFRVSLLTLFSIIFPSRSRFPCSPGFERLFQLCSEYPWSSCSEHPLLTLFSISCPSRSRFPCFPCLECLC